MSAATEKRRRTTVSRPVRVLVVAAIGLGLAGGLTGAALGAVGSAASTEAVLEHGGHGAHGIDEHGRPGDRDDDAPAPLSAPAPAPARP